MSEHTIKCGCGKTAMDRSTVCRECLDEMMRLVLVPEPIRSEPIKHVIAESRE